MAEAKGKEQEQAAPAPGEHVVTQEGRRSVNYLLRNKLDEALATAQSKYGQVFPFCRPMFRFLERLGVDKLELTRSVFSNLREILLGRIHHLSENDRLRLLHECEELYDIPQCHPLIVELLSSLESIDPSNFPQAISVPSIYSRLSKSVRHKLWRHNPTVFCQEVASQVSSVCEAMSTASRSTDLQGTNVTLRAKHPAFERLINMVGVDRHFYLLAVRILERMSKSPQFSAVMDVRCDLAMSSASKLMGEVSRSDPGYNISVHIDAALSASLGTSYESLSSVFDIISSAARQLLPEDVRRFVEAKETAEREDENRLSWVPKAIAYVKSFRENSRWRPFWESIEVLKQYPNYAATIKHPINVPVILNKLEQNEYASREELRSDMELLFRNAIKFNSLHAPVGRTAKKGLEAIQAAELFQDTMGKLHSKRKRNEVPIHKTKAETSMAMWHAASLAQVSPFRRLCAMIIVRQLKRSAKRGPKPQHDAQALAALTLLASRDYLGSKDNWDEMFRVLLGCSDGVVRPPARDIFSLMQICRFLVSANTYLLDCESSKYGEEFPFFSPEITFLRTGTSYTLLTALLCQFMQGLDHRITKQERRISTRRLSQANRGALVHANFPEYDVCRNLLTLLHPVVWGDFDQGFDVDSCTNMVLKQGLSGRALQASKSSSVTIEVARPADSAKAFLTELELITEGVVSKLDELKQLYPEETAAEKEEQTGPNALKKEVEGDTEMGKKEQRGEDSQSDSARGTQLTAAALVGLSVPSLASDASVTRPAREPSTTQPSTPPLHQPSTPPLNEPSTPPLSSASGSSKPEYQPSTPPLHQPSTPPLSSASGSSKPGYQPSTPPLNEPSTPPLHQPSTPPLNEPSTPPLSSASGSSKPEYQPSTPPLHQPSTNPLHQPSTPPLYQPSTPPLSSASGSSKPGYQPSTPPLHRPSTPPLHQPSTPPLNEPSTPPLSSASGSSKRGNQPSTPPLLQPSTRPLNEPSTPPLNEPSTPPLNGPSTPPLNGPSTPPLSSAQGRHEFEDLPGAPSLSLDEEEPEPPAGSNSKKPATPTSPHKMVNKGHAAKKQLTDHDEEHVEEEEIKSSTRGRDGDVLLDLLLCHYVWPLCAAVEGEVLDLLQAQIEEFFSLYQSQANERCKTSLELYRAVHSIVLATILDSGEEQIPQGNA